MISLPSETFEYQAEDGWRSEQELEQEYRGRFAPRSGSSYRPTPRYRPAPRPATAYRTPPRGMAYRTPLRPMGPRLPAGGQRRPLPPYPPRRPRPRPRPFPYPYPVREPWAVNVAGPGPSASEYARWVQASLNQVMNLQLPVDGVMSQQVRDAVRDFQRSRQLPADGFVGPDTERALIEARRGGGAAPGGPQPTGGPPPSSAAAPPGAEPAANGAAPKDAPANGQPAASEPPAQGEWEWELGGAIARGAAGAAAGVHVSDRLVGETLRMAKRPASGLGINLEQLLARHQAEAGGIPIDVLLAFIRFEAGGRLFNDATAGKLNPKTGRYSPTFFELGVFQTPAGAHGCAPVGGKKVCQYMPPGPGVERSAFGKGWHAISGKYPTAATWTDPTMQVRVGLWDLRTTGERIANEFRDLFPSRQSEWYVRMAVLYSFAVGAGWTRAFLRKYRAELLRLPEGQRWDFLRGKTAYLKGYGTRTFQTHNVDEKMALAARLRTARSRGQP